MRRRDAENRWTIEGQPKRWLRVSALLLSSALHLALLAAAARFSTWQPAALAPIRISLRSGGAAGGVQPGTAVPNNEVSAKPAGSQPPTRARRRTRTAATARARAVARSVQVPAVSLAPAVERTREAGDGASGVDHNVAAGEGMVQHANTGSGAAAGAGHAVGLGDGAGPDQRAYCVYCPEPYYPLIARARGWQGTVEVALSVLADGSVNGASLWRSSGHGVLDQAAVAAARHSRFALPPASSVPPPVRGRIEYRFQLITAR